MNVQVHGATHTGKVRDHNEDSLWYSTEHAAGIVSDGMGGHAAGEVASSITVESFRRVVGSRLSTAGSVDDVARIVSNSMGLANQEVHVAVQEDESRASMGATCVCACVWNGSLVVGNIGDSRAYMLSDGRLEQLTRDDSFVQKLLDDGVIEEAQAKVHPSRNMIVKYIGGDKVAEPAVTMHELTRGDRVLLCSDGLTGVVQDDAISDILGGGNTLEETCGRLIEATLDNGAPDNVTVVVFEVA